MIEDNVPVPSDGKQKYLFAKLLPGQSVLHRCAPEDKRKVSKAAWRVAGYKKWDAIVRVLPEGVRMWRIR